MLLENCLSGLVIAVYLVRNVISVANERKRVFKFTKVNSMQTFFNRDNVGKPPINTNSKSVLSCATILMQHGPFTCMEFFNLQDQCRSNNGGETVQSLITDMNNGWSFYNVESVGNSSEECKLDDLGRKYRGNKNTTATGIPCMVWSALSPWVPSPNTLEPLTLEEGPQILNTNYCRNPDYDAGGPWCFTMDPNVMWQNCGVPFCHCYT